MLNAVDTTMPIRQMAATMFEPLDRSLRTADPKLPTPDPEPRPGSAPDYVPSPVPPVPDTDMPGMPSPAPAI